MRKAGVLFIGALGYIGTAVIAGSLAIGRGLAKKAAMVTELERFSRVALVEPGDLVFGGWEIRASTPYESARRFFGSNQLAGSELLPAIEEELRLTEANIYPGITTNCGKAIGLLSGHNAIRDSFTLMEQAESLRSDIREFKEANSLDSAVVVNLASTEPPLELKQTHLTKEGVERCIVQNRREEIRASTLYAYAAIQESCPYINFTPSNGALVPGIIELSEARGVPVMGNDGKTGETLVKSALIPLFMTRNLEILSWEGFNILGNMDGRVLEEPENRASKTMTKDGVLAGTLGYSPHSGVHIHYVPSLDDQKTAWNFIHFRGFLGAKMSLQFIWQGYDSLLAAPLVIDLARLSLFSMERGESGVMKHLSSFFKAPVGVTEHRLSEQFRMLTDYLEEAKRGAVP